jgi:16S rRNA (cytosine967-C5)-methyltransferase
MSEPIAVGMSEPIVKYWASAARKAAFDVLLEVEQTLAHSDDLLRVRKIRRLSEADRNLTTALVLGVLRWQRVLDEAVQPLLKKPNARLDLEVRLALRLAAFQIFFMDRIPTRAAIDESVELTKLAGHKFASGLVNAVLRKLAAGPRPEFDPIQAYPEWMVERWRKAYGDEAADAICSAGMEQPTHAVRLTDQSVEEELRAAGIELEPGRLVSRAWLVRAGDITATEAFQAGRVRIQDEISQLVGEIAAFDEASDPKKKKILDACAAPGGKTMILAERNPQALVVACEINEQRFSGLKKRLAAANERIQCRLADACEPVEPGFYDRVLVDAPCSGTGTLGRNPEIRHRLALEDLERQATRQKAILGAALKKLRPGGRAIYSTCSIEREENDAVVEAALATSVQARTIPLTETLEKMALAGILTSSGVEQLRSRVTDAGWLRILPGELGPDGFFVAALAVSA